MSEDTKQVFLTFFDALFPPGLIIVCSFLFLKKWLKTKIEEEVKSKYDKELEEVRATLAVLVNKQQFRYSHVFVLTAKAIETAFAMLYDVHEATSTFIGYASYTNRNSQEFEKYETAAGTALNEFVKYYAIKRIYFPKKTADKLEKYVTALHDVIFTYKEALIVFDEDRQKGVDKVAEAKRIVDETPKLRAILEDDFRDILGLLDVTDKSKK